MPGLMAKPWYTADARSTPEERFVLTNPGQLMLVPISESEFMRLRFAIGSLVECQTEDGWQPGTVTRHWYTQKSFPQNMCAPYQVRLDTGKMIFAPMDEDQFIRIHPTHTLKAEERCVQAECRELRREQADKVRKPPPTDSSVCDAAHDGQLKRLRKLLDKGGNPDAKETFGSALMMACLEDNDQCAALLLERGARVNQTREGGETALHNACANGSVRCTKLLLDAGANPSARAKDNDTPVRSCIQSADENGGVECLRILLRAGAQHGHAWRGRTPLAWAHAMNKPQHAKELEAAGGARDESIVRGAGAATPERATACTNLSPPGTEMAGKSRPARAQAPASSVSSTRVSSTRDAEQEHSSAGGQYAADGEWVADEELALMRLGFMQQMEEAANGRESMITPSIVQLLEQHMAEFGIKPPFGFSDGSDDDFGSVPMHAPIPPGTPPRTRRSREVPGGGAKERKPTAQSRAKKERGRGSGAPAPGEFIPSEKFDGAKPGMVFQNGPHGCGYYLDGTSSASVSQRTASPADAATFEHATARAETADATTAAQPQPQPQPQPQLEGTGKNAAKNKKKREKAKAKKAAGSDIAAATEEEPAPTPGEPAPTLASAPSPAPVSPPEPPDEFICPISQELMVDPVLASDGHAYERQSIERWFEKRLTSPKTGEALQTPALFANHPLRRMILEWREAHDVAACATA